MRAALARWGDRHGARILAIAFFIPAALLFAPVLYYSLDTPFGLVDDYADWKYSIIFTSPALFLDWVDFTFLGTDVLRYRPFWDFYNAAAWSVFGTTPWLHHLSRWIFHFAAVLMFALAFLRFGRAEGHRTWMLPLVPVTFLVYIWLFFPNSPPSRLSPQEVYTVFFLGMCTLAVALTLTGKGGEGWIRSGGMKYGLFLLGYTGLVLSKEVNLGIALWFLFAYIVHASTGSGKKRKVIGAIPVVFLFAFNVSRSWIASINYDSAISSRSPNNHVVSIFEGMFQTETSLIITVGFALLTSMAVAIAGVRFIRQRTERENIFLLFLIGQASSLYLTFSLLPGNMTLRYWYPMIPVFAILMAFSLKYIMRFSRQLSPWVAVPLPIVLLSFVAFFCAVNYYNFLGQTVLQHSGRNADDSIISEVSHLSGEGEPVYIEGSASGIEQERSLFRYFTEYQPFMRGDDHDMLTWRGWPYVLAISFPPSTNVLRDNSAEDPGHPYYFVALYWDDTILDLLDIHKRVSETEEYAILSHARTLAEFFQRGTPHHSVDDGAPSPEGYGWTIYRIPFGDPRDRAIDSLRGIYVQTISREPDARAAFTIYSLEDRLIYVRERCAPEDTAWMFALHLVPRDRDDLPRGSRRRGFDNLDFRFATYGASFDGRCVAVVPLPDYAIASIRTGQYIPPNDGIWSVEFAPGLAEFLPAAYGQAANSDPVVRSTFDLYFIENQLIYVRERCAPEDTDALFLLHLTPVDTDDLPDERRQYGFDNLDFRFAVRGTSFDGRCVAAVPLPDYPIAGIRTGQYGDEGEIWSVEFAPER